jgi:hypothetical protein
LYHSPNQRQYISLAPGIGLSAIIPLTSFNEMFLFWDVDQPDAPDETIPGDLNHGEGEGNNDGESTVRYISEKEYDK